MYTSSGLKLKIFVKEQGNNASKLQEDERLKFSLGATPLTGEKAKEFYEDILNEPSSSTKKERKQLVIESTAKPLKPAHNKVTTKVYKDSDLLRMAQNNEVKNLEIFFSQNQNYDVNIVDDFGWTPLMCAACSGAEEAVKILLRNGADPNKCDRLGNTALKLAKYKNQKKIVTILENFYTDDETKEEVKAFVEPYFCTLCKEQVTLNKKKHETSTLHLFNSKIKTPTFYGIPESNKGFQLLLKEGWNKNKGLGPSGTGRKFPIKAAVKKDRSGIGAEPKDKRKNHAVEITHTEKCPELKMEDPNKSLKYLQELESLGEEILVDRREIIALDKRRNQTREGLRELKKIQDSKVWFALGPLLVKYPTKKVEEMLKKDQVQVDAEINKLRSNLKVKVNDLRDMEHQPPVPGLMLKAMTSEEMNAIGQVLGRHAD